MNLIRFVFFKKVLISLKTVVVNAGVVFEEIQFWMNLRKRVLTHLILKVEGWKLVDELNKFEIITLGIEPARG